MRGNGRIFQRGNIFWAAYYLRGKEFRESTNETDEKKAGKFLQGKLREIGADQLGARTFVTPQASRLTVHELVEALRQDYQLRGKLSPQSGSHLDRVDADFGQFRATALTAERVDRYVRERVDAGDAPSSINRTCQLLGQSYKLAIRRGHLAKAPAIRHLSEAGNARQGFFSEQEFWTVHSHLPADLKDFVEFAFVTGMRKNEIASLTWKDVDGDVIRLRAENAKNGEARLVPVVGALSEIIKRRQVARRLEENGAVRMVEFVFHRNGEPVQGFRKSWATACVAAGVGKWICPTCKGEGTDRQCPDCEVAGTYQGRIFHDFRRSAIRNMVSAGVNPQVAKKISGHKTDSMFQRYSILTTDDLRAALERTEEHRGTEKQKVVSIGGKQ